MSPARQRIEIPAGHKQAEIRAGDHTVRLTNLDKVFWPELGLTKRDLLQYYADVSPVLLPHVANRAMVMKRYPHGAAGPFFFMKRAPEYRPDWLRVCSIEHASGSVIDFAIVEDEASLLWVVNLGCIDLNQWYATCDDTDRPDYLHFDLDPVPEAGFERVLETALRVREMLDALGAKSYPKTSGSKGIHVYVPIVRGPVQKQVWTFAKEISKALEAQYPRLITAEYRVARRPADHVLVDYNQNAWGRTLASVYSVRPRPRATVSTPVTWEEVEQGFSIEEFRMDNVPERVARVGDLFKPLLKKTGRMKLERFLK
jgi:bifunctional non-homologous end joining protein LigD